MVASGEMNRQPARGKVRILALCGSPRVDSFTELALRRALEGVGPECETSLVRLAEHHLPLHNGSSGDNVAKPVQDLRELIRSADALLIGTPVYHGSFTGVLKNALDWLGFRELEGKMIGLVGVAGGAGGAYEALGGLRNVGRALHAWVVPQQVSIEDAWKVFDEHGRPKSGSLDQRLLVLGAEVARFARLHRAAQADEFLHSWESAQANPGGAADRL